MIRFRRLAIRRFSLDSVIPFFFFVFMVLRTLPIERNLLRRNLGEEGFDVSDSAGEGAYLVVKRLQRRGGGTCLLLGWLLSFLGFCSRHDSDVFAALVASGKFLREMGPSGFVEDLASGRPELLLVLTSAAVHPMLPCLGRLGGVVLSLGALSLKVLDDG